MISDNKKASATVFRIVLVTHVLLKAAEPKPKLLRSVSGQGVVTCLEDGIWTD